MSVTTAKATFVPVERPLPEPPSVPPRYGGLRHRVCCGGSAFPMTVAVSTSADADHARQKAIEYISELLEQLHDEKLESLRSQLDRSRDGVDKATTLRLAAAGGAPLVYSSVHAISTATRTPNDA